MTDTTTTLRWLPEYHGVEWLFEDADTATRLFWLYVVGAVIIPLVLTTTKVLGIWDNGMILHPAFVPVAVSISGAVNAAFGEVVVTIERWGSAS